MSDRREFPRYIAELPGRISQPLESQAISVTVVNLSVSGCSLDGAHPLKANQDCELTILWEGREFSAQALVTWKSGKGEAGLKFLYVDQVNQALLRQICANLRLQPLTPMPADPDDSPAHR